MALQSMTGFARHEANYGNAFWAWEIRSVNGKGLDLRLRLPSGFEALEIAAKKFLSGHFSRGNMQVSLVIDNSKSELSPKLNHEMLGALIDVSKEIQAETGGELPNASVLMNMRGVVELGEGVLDQDVMKARQSAMMESLKVAASELTAMREVEGQAMVQVLKDQLKTISETRAKIDDDKARTPEVIFERMKMQVSKLLGEAEGLDEQRLHQEVAILATKADLQEELDRLAAHIVSAGDLLNSKGPIGRKLDFLAQEFNRECNTICSKSNAASVTALGLDMKIVIDQFREQIQNME